MNKNMFLFLFLLIFVLIVPTQSVFAGDNPYDWTDQGEAAKNVYEKGKQHSGDFYRGFTGKEDNGSKSYDNGSRARERYDSAKEKAKTEKEKVKHGVKTFVDAWKK